MKFAFFYVLWEDPLVCVISAGSTLEGGIELALDYAAGRPCHILVRPSWELTIIGDEIARTDWWLRETHPGVKLVLMATSAADVDHMAGLGVESICAHNGAFIDERIYFPEPGATKVFDAVHTAQTKPFKRHELAYGVPNLALITYAEPGAEPVGDLVARYRHLKYVNYSESGGCVGLDGAQVRRVVGQARCGLILSEEEGPNNASMEYFLCGVPLVTTPSRGGREELYDPRHVAVVEPTAEAVEAAVAAFQVAAPDPREIRAAALARARPHRQRLIAWLSNVVGEDLFTQADENLWLPQFHDKLRKSWLFDVRPEGSVRIPRQENWGVEQARAPADAPASSPAPPAWFASLRASWKAIRDWRGAGQRAR
jgi:hypothetical protein